MDPNLVRQSFTYKDLLLRKLSYAVISSVILQFFILQLYLFICNANILHPTKWLLATLGKTTSVSTWLFVVPFLLIIFAQCLICAKDYVMKTTYCSTRFQKFVATFSVHNFALLTLHTAVGGTSVWLFLSIAGGQYKNLIDQCDGQSYLCLNEGTLFLITSGLWMGLYFFIKIYIAEKTLHFPVVHQRKLLQAKAHLGPLLKESITFSFWPSLYFSCVYYVYGESLENILKRLFGLIESEGYHSLWLFVHLWFFGALYFFNMNLMRFFFNLFLTEPVQFPINKDQTTDLTLLDSITNSDWPIVQNLACLDLHRLSEWSPERRRVFFILSNPGGHPHNWNALVENVLKLISEYTQLLIKTIEVPEKPEEPKVPIVQAPLIQGLDKFRNLRNMSLIRQENYNMVTVTRGPVVDYTVLENFAATVSAKFHNAWNFLKMLLGINFLFGELPQANIRKCLANGNLIIWSIQGLTNIVVASLEEDPFGIVQKDIPAIISSLVALKQSLDKLNKVPALTRKMVGYDDFNYRMKGAVTGAAKRSLFHICWKFSSYLDDIPLNKEVTQYLHSNIICKS